MNDVGSDSYRPSGRVTLATLMSLREAGEAAIAGAGDRLVVDLAGIENGNSAGVALLIAWFREAERLGKSIVFRAAPDDLRNIVDLSGMSNVLPLVDGQQDDAAAGASQ